MTDVALDPYNSDGHDGLVEFRSDGTMEILNDDSGWTHLFKQKQC